MEKKEFVSKQELRSRYLNYRNQLSMSERKEKRNLCRRDGKDSMSGRKKAFGFGNCWKQNRFSKRQNLF